MIVDTLEEQILEMISIANMIAETLEEQKEEVLAWSIEEAADKRFKPDNKFVQTAQGNDVYRGDSLELMIDANLSGDFDIDYLDEDDDNDDDEFELIDVENSSTERGKLYVVLTKSHS